MKGLELYITITGFVTLIAVMLFMSRIDGISRKLALAAETNGLVRRHWLTRLIQAGVQILSLPFWVICWIAGVLGSILGNVINVGPWFMLMPLLGSVFGILVSPIWAWQSIIERSSSELLKSILTWFLSLVCLRTALVWWAARKDSARVSWRWCKIAPFSWLWIPALVSIAYFFILLFAFLNVFL